LRERMKLRCYEQAKKFSWDVAAQQILDAYREVAASGRARLFPDNAAEPVRQSAGS
jgi:hypothetical protein